jgi:hypothetical protein
MRFKEFMTEGLADMFTSKPKVDWNKRAKELFAQGMDEQKVRAQLLKEGCPLGQVDKYVQGGQLEESATAGATSAGAIGTVVSPHLAIGKSRHSKSYSGSPGKSGTKSPKPPKIVQRKKKNGTATNALDMKGNIFGGGSAIKR